MIRNIDEFFIQADYICDCVPAISTINNIINLFLKTVVLPFIDEEIISNKCYYAHLKNKAFLRCIVLSVPIIGNIIIKTYDFIDKKLILASIEEAHYTRELFKSASKTLQNDKDVALAVVKKTGRVLKYASKMIRNDKDIVLAAVKQDGFAFEYASQELKNDKDIH